MARLRLWLLSLLFLGVLGGCTAAIGGGIFPAQLAKGAICWIAIVGATAALYELASRRIAGAYALLGAQQRVLASLLAGVVGVFVLVIVPSIAFGARLTPGLPSTGLVLIVVSIVAVEELIFRGLLMSLFKRLFGELTAVWLSATCFALAHMIAQPRVSLFVQMLALGLTLGALTAMTKSLVGAITFHSVYNLTWHSAMQDGVLRIFDPYFYGWMSDVEAMSLQLPGVGGAIPVASFAMVGGIFIWVVVQFHNQTLKKADSK